MVLGPLDPNECHVRFFEDQDNAKDTGALSAGMPLCEGSSHSKSEEYIKEGNIREAGGDADAQPRISQKESSKTDWH